MSYVNLVAQACVTPEECFQRMRDFICRRNGTYDYSTTGIGWTLHDSSYATDEDNLTDGDFIVIYSAGESGDDDMYIKLDYEVTTTWAKVTGYLYWNNSTHAGVLPFNTAPYGIFTRGSDHVLYIYGDLSSFSVIQYYNSSTYQGSYFGKADNLLYDDTVATCSGSLTAGSDVSIALDAVPSTWEVDQAFFIRDDAGIEKAIIKTIVSNTITADLVNSYAAGSKSQTDNSFVIPRAAAMGSSYGLAGHSGVFASANIFVTEVAIANTVVSGCIPDTMNSSYLANTILIYDNNPDGYYGILRNFYITTVAGKTALDILITKDGDEYRYIYVGVYHLLFKEV